MSDRWQTRCSKCGNPMHFLRFYIAGWLAYWLFAKTWPVAWGLPPFLATAGDCIYDARECRKSCRGRELLDEQA